MRPARRTSATRSSSAARSPALNVLDAVGEGVRRDAAGKRAIAQQTRNSLGVQVPLDRSGAVAGKVSLCVQRRLASGPRTGVVVALAGGPGQSATLAITDRPAIRAHVAASLRGYGGDARFRRLRSARHTPLRLPVLKRSGRVHQRPVPCRSPSRAACTTRRASALVSSAPDAPSTRPSTRLRTWRPCGGRLVWHGSPCSRAPTGRRWPSPMPVAIRRAWSAWPSTRFWIPTDPTSSRATASLPCRAASSPCAGRYAGE